MSRLLRPRVFQQLVWKSSTMFHQISPAIPAVICIIKMNHETTHVPAIHAPGRRAAAVDSMPRTAARQFIKANRDRPFFCYVPLTIPHVALQVPEDSLAEYRGLWDDPPYDAKKGYKSII